MMVKGRQVDYPLYQFPLMMDDEDVLPPFIDVSEIENIVQQVESLKRSSETKRDHAILLDKMFQFFTTFEGIRYTDSTGKRCVDYRCRKYLLLLFNLCGQNLALDANPTLDQSTFVHNEYSQPYFERMLKEWTFGEDVRMDDEFGYRNLSNNPNKEYWFLPGQADLKADNDDEPPIKTSDTPGTTSKEKDVDTDQSTNAISDGDEVPTSEQSEEVEMRNVDDLDQEEHHSEDDGDARRDIEAEASSKALETPSNRESPLSNVPSISREASITKDADPLPREQVDPGANPGNRSPIKRSRQVTVSSADAPHGHDTRYRVIKAVKTTVGSTPAQLAGPSKATKPPSSSRSNKTLRPEPHN